MNSPDRPTSIPVFAVLGKDYDYDDERYYTQEGYHLHHLYESEDEANAFARETNLKILLGDDSLERYCDRDEPESIYGHDPAKLQAVRDALGVPTLTAEELINLSFTEKGRLNKEQAAALLRILDIGDFYISRQELFLRRGAAVEAEQAAA